MNRILLPVLALLVCATLVSAQPLSGDYVGVGIEGKLFRIDASGQVTTFQVGTGLLHGWTMDYDNRGMLVTDATARAVYLLDGSFAVKAVYPMPVQMPLDVTVDQNGDILFTDGLSNGVHRLCFHGGVFPVATSLAPNLHGGLVIDVDTSDLLVTRGGGTLDGNPVLRVSRDGAAVTTIPAGVTGSFGMTQAPDGTMWAASLAGTSLERRILYRFRADLSEDTGYLGSIPGTSILGASAVASDRGSAPTQRLLMAAYDRQGIWLLDTERATATQVSTLAEPLLDVGFVGGRNLGSARVGPRRWAVDATFPGEAGRMYVIVMGYSGVRPALTFPDGRRLWLVPDALTEATLGKSIPPFLTGNVGRLDALGRGLATLDLTTLPREADGIVVWFAAATLDSGAPFGIATISDPMVFRIE
jgi:hypothetical protein